MSHNQTMEAITVVVVGAVVLIVLFGVGSMLAGGSVYDKIGEGGLSMDSPSGASEDAENSPRAHAERELEIRQMLMARSERLVRQGGEALDIDAELARLDKPADTGAV